MNDPSPRPNPRRRWPIYAGGGAVLTALVVGGIIAAAGQGPSRTLPSAATPASAQASSATAGAPQGTGRPIALTGSDPVTGRAVRLADSRGKPTVLAIWASWCHGCNEEAPHLAKVAGRRSDVNFVGLNFRDDANGAKGFYRRYGWDFPSIADESGDLSFKLGLQGTPTTLFLDAEHREIGRIVGAVDEAGFDQALDRITART